MTQRHVFRVSGTIGNGAWGALYIQLPRDVEWKIVRVIVKWNFAEYLHVMLANVALAAAQLSWANDMVKAAWYTAGRLEDRCQDLMIFDPWYARQASPVSLAFNIAHGNAGGQTVEIVAILEKVQL